LDASTLLFDVTSPTKIFSLGQEDLGGSPDVRVVFIEERCDLEECAVQIRRLFRCSVTGRTKSVRALPTETELLTALKVLYLNPILALDLKVLDSGLGLENVDCDRAHGGFVRFVPVPESRF